jgi:hypothetical protein
VATTGPAAAAPATAATPPTATTTPTSGTAAISATTGATAAAGSPGNGIAQYQQQDIVSALKSLISDLSNSQLVSSTSSGTGSSSNVASTTISALNQAFSKLITDLGGTTAPAAGATAGTTSTGSAGGTSATAGTAGGAAPDTSALQSFLTGFLNDLQNGSSPVPGPLGNSVNTTA